MNRTDDEHLPAADAQRSLGVLQQLLLQRHVATQRAGGVTQQLLARWHVDDQASEQLTAIREAAERHLEQVLTDGTGPVALEVAELEAAAELLGVQALYRLVQRCEGRGVELLEASARLDGRVAAVEAWWLYSEAATGDQRPVSPAQREWVMRTVLADLEPWELAEVLDDLPTDVQHDFARGLVDVCERLDQLPGSVVGRELDARLRARLPEEQLEVAQRLRAEGWQGSLDDLVEAAQRLSEGRP